MVAVTKQDVDLASLAHVVAQKDEEARKDKKKVKFSLEKIKGTSKWMLKSWKVKE